VINGDGDYSKRVPVDDLSVRENAAALHNGNAGVGSDRKLSPGHGLGTGEVHRAARRFASPQRNT